MADLTLTGINWCNLIKSPLGSAAASGAGVNYDSSMTPSTMNPFGAAGSSNLRQDAQVIGLVASASSVRRVPRAALAPAWRSVA